METVIFIMHTALKKQLLFICRLMRMMYGMILQTGEFMQDMVKGALLLLMRRATGKLGI